MPSLRDSYLREQAQKTSALNEGILDLLTGNTQNVQRVRAALHATKTVAQTYGMKNITNAVTMAEKSFESSLASKGAKDKAQVMSNITTFSDVMADFFREMDQWIMQLPSMAQALQQAQSPENKEKTLRDLLGPQDSVQIGSIIQKQFYKSGNSFLRTLSRFFTPGMRVDANAALAAFGMDSKKAADDILGIKPVQYNQIVQTGKAIQPVELATSNTTPTKTDAPSAPGETAKPGGTTPAAPPAGAAPTATPEPTTKPNATEIQQRNASLSALTNQTAFVPGEIAKLSNDEVKAQILQIAKQLGIKLA